MQAYRTFPSLSSNVNYLSEDGPKRGKWLHLQPGRTEEVKVLIEQVHEPQAGLVLVVKAPVEEDVSYDIERSTADEKGRVKRLAWKTGKMSAFMWDEKDEHDHHFS